MKSPVEKTLVLAAGIALTVSIATTTACRGKLILTEQAEARRMTSALHLDFVKASEATNRAVLAGSDEAAAAAATEADQATTAAQARLDELSPVVHSLAYDDEVRILESFMNRFSEYRKVNAEILGLAVENTNLKAQRLSFGAGQDAADALTSALATITSVAGDPDVEAAAGAVRASVLEVQVLEARHIAEPEDASMSRLEAQMSAAEVVAQKGLDRLRTRAPAQAGPLMAAQAALDRFMATNREIVELSRRNSNVRSVAATLGRRRVVAAECEEQLQALEAALAAHTFNATR